VIEVLPYKNDPRKGWAIYENGQLLAVCCYRKGAFTVKGRIEALLAAIYDLQAVQVTREAAS
jgi:hypothetical protein